MNRSGKGQRSYTQLHGKLNLTIVTYLIFTYKLLLAVMCMPTKHNEFNLLLFNIFNNIIIFKHLSLMFFPHGSVD
jgi:hypothetical protein